MVATLKIQPKLLYSSDVSANNLLKIIENLQKVNKAKSKKLSEKGKAETLFISLRRLGIEKSDGSSISPQC